jgi:hypothetical protein
MNSELESKMVGLFSIHSLLWVFVRLRHGKMVRKDFSSAQLIRAPRLANQTMTEKSLAFGRVNTAERFG